MPFDNIKTRMQSTGKSGMRMTSVASQMLASEGLFVFWRATTPRLVRLTVRSAYSHLELPLIKTAAIKQYRLRNLRLRIKNTWPTHFGANRN